MLIFGYGSLLDPSEIKSHIGESESVREVMLPHFKRDWEAKDESGRYLGISPSPHAYVNGIIFDLPIDKLSAFRKSENIPKLYTLKEVGYIAPGKPQKFIIPFNFYGAIPVLACVTRHPTHTGLIPPSYIKAVKLAVAQRSLGFQQDFWNTTPRGKK